MEIEKVVYHGPWLFLIFLDLVIGDFRILGGTNSRIEKHPWDVSIQNRGSHFCGGVIIGVTQILTAAHCLYNKRITSRFRVVVGTADLDDTKRAGKYSIKRAIAHGLYSNETFDYDIALITTNKIKFGSRVTNIRLPNPGLTIPVRHPLVISGWGVVQRHEKKAVKILQSAVIYSVDWNECKPVLSRINPFTETMICAGIPTGEKDSCQGDSGGGLEMNGVLVGITSWGVGCGYPGFPGVYANVSYFRDWIRVYAKI